jgi:Mor family transcriptional regulator
MARKGSSRSAELIVQLVGIGTPTLVEQFGVSELQAHQAMREIAHNLARSYGGQLMYVPRDQDFALTKRDMQIYERMGRESIHELAKEFDLTVQQLYSINRYVRDQIQRKRQNALPGFEDQPTEGAST